MKSPSAPTITQDQLDLEAMQRTQSAKLDATENDRRKRLLSAAEGIRAYSGSPLFRGRPSNTAGGNTTSDAPVRSNAPAFVPTRRGTSSGGGGTDQFVKDAASRDTKLLGKILNPFGW